jgi:hypothetical protein
MKKNILYLFAHQDDEFGTFIDISKKIKNYNIYVFYLTSGYSSKISKYKLLKRDKESIKVLHKLGVRKKNIIFLGKKLNIKVNRLYVNLSKAYKELILFTKFIKPHILITHSWEGGHEDHDACNLIARKVGFKFKNINKFKEFSLYNAYKCRLLYFKVFNPIKKKGTYSRTNFCSRLLHIRFLFYYTTQFKIWIGLYPFIIMHYLFLGYNFLQPLNNSKKIKKPHTGRLLYEIRNFCNFKEFKEKTIFFLSH